MSSPLSSLKKTRRVPLPGRSDGERMPFRDGPHMDYHRGCEAALLGSIFPPNVPAGPPTETEGPSTVRSKASHKRHDCTPPGDSELMSAMIQRLTKLERKVKTQALDIESKARKIVTLEERLRIQTQESKEKNNGRDSDEDQTSLCHRLQKQVQDMERFLSDYGMRWVGSSESQEVAKEQDVDPAEPTDILWQPGASLIGQFHMNFDRVLQSIRELNVLAGEGESYVRAVPGGARLARPSPVPLWLYSNGIVMFSGPFRSYQQPSTQRCMRDLMDGYFPSELQERFPDGVPFEVHDRREEEFKVIQRRAKFPGRGQTIADSVKQPVDLAKITVVKYATAHCSEVPVGRKLSMVQFLNRLPRTVVKAGKVLSIRDSVKANLLESSDDNSHSVTIIETPAMQDLKERSGSSKATSYLVAPDITTLRVRSEDGGHTFLLKMYFSESIGHLRQYLVKHRGSQVLPYDIISAFPKRRYHDDTQTLQACGLTPSATLLLRTRPSHSAGVGLD